MIIPGQVDYDWVKDKVSLWCKPIAVEALAQLHARAVEHHAAMAGGDVQFGLVEARGEVGEGLGAVVGEGRGVDDGGLEQHALQAEVVAATQARLVWPGWQALKALQAPQKGELALAPFDQV